ncbi:helicase [Kitasatospora cinereorecta]|uniref:Helicase n=1 Tax=Kitasatospora cinereorecta TaxID=285560 RepID=A0ABW0VGH7_9ACTN
MWLSDTKTRRDRLDQERLAQFAGLGLPWATVAPA